MGRRFDNTIKTLRAAGKHAEADAKEKRRGRVRNAFKAIGNVVATGAKITGDVVPGASIVSNALQHPTAKKVLTVREQVLSIIPLGFTVYEAIMTLWEALQDAWETVRGE